jgi:predicted Zn-dependent protease
VIVGAVLLMIGVGTAALVVVVWRMQAPRTNYPVRVRVEEDEEERREQLRKAFKDRKPLDAAEIAQQVQPILDKLGAALRDQDADRITAEFDLDRLLDEFVAAGGTLLVRTTKERRDFRRGMREGLGKNFAEKGVVFHWNATEIRNIKKLNNEEAVVIARHAHPNSATLKLRWWLTRRNGEWKIYDLEDLDTGSRVSSDMASVLGHGVGRAVEIGRAVKTISEAIQAVALDDVDGANQKLDQVQQVQLPPRFESLRQLATGMVLLRREKYAESLRALEDAHRLQPDFPLVDMLSGLALNRLGKPDQALKHLHAYRDLLGEDADVCREIGEALRAQSRFPEAAKEYRHALDFNPKEAEAFLGLLRSLGGNDNKDDVGPRFAKLDSLRENFDVCAEDCESREFPELLEPLVQTMRRLDPDYPPVDYYQALVQARTGHPDEAARSLKSALAKQTDRQQRQVYEQQFLKAMGSGGHYTQAYAAATDAREAFRVLAAEAVKRYQGAELKQLVADHAEKHPADPLLALYQAEILVRDAQYGKADKAFTEALARHPDEEVLRSFRASRVLARYHEGQAMAAYRDIGPREETFSQLASLLLLDGENAQLQTLLDTHAKEFPDSIEAACFGYRLLIRQNNVAEGIALFKSALTKAKTQEKRSEVVSQFLSEMQAANKPLEGYQAAPDAAAAFQQLAESLLESDRWDDLRGLLEAHCRGHADDPWLAYYQAEVHRHDEAWDKMAAVLGEALKGEPKDADDSIRPNYVFALYKMGRWERAYAEIEPRDETFTQLANLMIQDKKRVELEALIGLHRPHAGDDPDLLYYDARSKVLANKWAEAVPLFRQAYQKQENPLLRDQYQSSFLQDMAAAERWLEGYRAAVDKDAALTTLASQLLMAKKDKELAALLEEQHQEGGGEPWYSFYLGELSLLRGEAKKAVPYFTAAVGKGTSANQWQLRDGLLRACVRAGEVVAAYEEGKGSEATFTSLASLCSRNKDAEQLRALLDAHRRNKPDDPSLISWELELRWLQQDYEGALRLLTEHREDVFTQPRFRWKADEYRVRCLVKQKQGREAVRAAEEIVKKRHSDRLLLVLAHAATADVPQTIAAMGQLGNESYFVRRCYQDADLGPLLRSEGFQAFRARYPEPKEDSSANGKKEAP